MDSVIRVLVVDDHPLIRRSIRALFADVKDVEVVGEASNGIQALEQTKVLYPDVVLMDLVMPGMNGTQAIEQIMACRSDTRVLVLTGFTSVDDILPAFQAGALGCLTKEEDPAELIRAVRNIYFGRSPIQPSVARQVLREWTGQRRKQELVEPLTKRERDILVLMAQGLGDAQISRQLNILEVTVRSHINHILGKLQAENRVQAVLWATRQGIVPTGGTSQRMESSANSG